MRLQARRIATPEESTKTSQKIMANYLSIWIFKTHQLHLSFWQQSIHGEPIFNSNHGTNNKKTNPDLPTLQPKHLNNHWLGLSNLAAKCVNSESTPGSNSVLILPHITTTLLVISKFNNAGGCRPSLHLLGDLRFFCLSDPFFCSLDTHFWWWYPCLVFLCMLIV